MEKLLRKKIMEEFIVLRTYIWFHILKRRLIDNIFMGLANEHSCGIF
jgi:hypothetical protein